VKPRFRTAGADPNRAGELERAGPLEKLRLAPEKRGVDGEKRGVEVNEWWLPRDPA
jgi:hypothetical protein